MQSCVDLFTFDGIVRIREQLMLAHNQRPCCFRDSHIRFRLVGLEKRQEIQFAPTRVTASDR